MRTSYILSTGLLTFLIAQASAQAAPSLKNLFDRQLQLRASVQNYNADQIKNSMTKLRYREDMLGEASVNFVRHQLTDSSTDAFSGEFLLNPKFSNIEFKSGDVLLIRGKSTVSATIAGITETPSQFSHLAMVYIDSSTQKKYVIEALIDSGTIVHDLNDVLHEGVPRMTLYRFQDSKLAASAAQIAYYTAQNFIANGKTIPYDFNFNMNDYKALYCAELIRMAFDLASAGQIKTPSHPSVFGPKLQNTLKSLQVENLNKTTLFAPADIDLDTRFDLVAEWRDFQSTLNIRAKDQILIVLLKWVEEGSFKVNYKQILDEAKLMSVQQQQQAGMTNSQDPNKIKALLDTLDKTMNGLTTLVFEENDIFLKKRGRNMSEIEIRNFLMSNKTNPNVQKTLMESGLIK